MKKGFVISDSNLGCNSIRRNKIYRLVADHSSDITATRSELWLTPERILATLNDDNTVDFAENATAEELREGIRRLMRQREIDRKDSIERAKLYASRFGELRKP